MRLDYGTRKPFYNGKQHRAPKQNYPSIQRQPPKQTPSTRQPLPTKHQTTTTHQNSTKHQNRFRHQKSSVHGKGISLTADQLIHFFTPAHAFPQTCANISDQPRLLPQEDENKNKRAPKARGAGVQCDKFTLPIGSGLFYLKIKKDILENAMN